MFGSITGSFCVNDLENEQLYQGWVIIYIHAVKEWQSTMKELKEAGIRTRKVERILKKEHILKN